MSNDLIKKVVSEAVHDLDIALEHLGRVRGQLKAIQHVDLTHSEQLLAKTKNLRQSLNRSLKSGSPAKPVETSGR